jgi:hypothetical protein
MGKIRLNECSFTDFGFKRKIPTLMRSVGAEGVIMPIKVCQRKND